jgi:hypothetical protein
MQTLKTPTGQIIAFIKGNRIYSPTQEYLGYYNPTTDMTYTARGEVVGQGNLLTLLV